MTVTAYPNDSTGTALLLDITNLTATVAALANSPSTLAYNTAAQALIQKQKDAVNHFLENGRILAATILSTLS